jgi:hypothetical protein
MSKHSSATQLDGEGQRRTIFVIVHGGGSSSDRSLERPPDGLSKDCAEREALRAEHQPAGDLRRLHPDTKWSFAQIAYVRSYATWHYLVEPYIFTWPGRRGARGGAVDGERTDVARAQRDVPRLDRHPQPDPAVLLQRRRSAAPDGLPAVVNGQEPVAHYIRSEGTFDGIVVPTKRHIHARNQDRTPDLSGIRITLDLSDIRFS